MSMKEALSKLNATLGALETDASEATHLDTVEMKPEEFIEHVTKHIVALKTDKPEIKKARVAYLRETLANVSKNFEGPTPGAVTLTMFRHPDQIQTTKTEPGMPSQPMGTNFSQQADLPPNGTPTPPSASGVQPPMAPPSGNPFVDSGSNFAKAMTAFEKAIATLSKADDDDDTQPPAEPDAVPTQPPPGEGDTAPETPEAKKAAEAKKTEASVTKSANEPEKWPLDMTSDVGLGKAETEKDPEIFFGWDR